jgi:hypothetical protein
MRWIVVRTLARTANGFWRVGIWMSKGAKGCARCGKRLMEFAERV